MDVTDTIAIWYAASESAANHGRATADAIMNN